VSNILSQSFVGFQLFLLLVMSGLIGLRYVQVSAKLLERQFTNDLPHDRFATNSLLEHDILGTHQYPNISMLLGLVGTVTNITQINPNAAASASAQIELIKQLFHSMYPTAVGILMAIFLGILHNYIAAKLGNETTNHVDTTFRKMPKNNMAETLQSANSAISKLETALSNVNRTLPEIVSHLEHAADEARQLPKAYSESASHFSRDLKQISDDQSIVIRELSLSLTRVSNKFGGVADGLTRVESAMLYTPQSLEQVATNIATQLDGLPGLIRGIIETNNIYQSDLQRCFTELNSSIRQFESAISERRIDGRQTTRSVEVPQDYMNGLVSVMQQLNTSLVALKESTVRSKDFQGRSAPLPVSPIDEIGTVRTVVSVKSDEVSDRPAESTQNNNESRSRNFFGKIIFWKK
jgi:hypothetical protein